LRYSARLFFVAALLLGSPSAAAETLAPVLHPVAPVDAGPVRSVFAKPGTPVPDAAGVNYSGTFAVDFTITIRSDISTQTPIYCDLYADFGGDANAYASMQKYDFVEATRSGNTAKCKVSLPYGLYGLLTPAKDYVSLQYTLAAGANLPVLVSTLPVAGAYVNGTIAVATLPANGKTTTLDVAAIL
jgi:hypothetical protein